MVAPSPRDHFSAARNHTGDLEGIFYCFCTTQTQKKLVDTIGSNPREGFTERRLALKHGRRMRASEVSRLSHHRVGNSSLTVARIAVEHLALEI
jgi:hypothetical protein